MALVDEDQRVVGQVLEQGRRRLAGAAPGEVTRVILDAGARAGRLDHLDVEAGALLQALCLEETAGSGELIEAELELLADALHRLGQRRPRRDVVRVGVDLHRLELAVGGAGQRVELDDRLDLVAEEIDAPGAVLKVGREQVDGVAADAERAAAEVGIAPLVLERDEVGDELTLVDALADGEREGHRRVGLDRADAVDAGDRGDDDHVVAFEQRARRRMAHPVDLLVDGRFLLDIGVGARDVGLGLVVVVIGDEILDRVLREERLELAVELGGEGLVGGKHQGRTLRRLDHLGHRVGLARAGDAEQHLVALLRVDRLDQLGDRLRLVALRLKLGDDLERDAALGLLRPWRSVRHPGLVAELGPAALDQRRQRLHRGSDAVRRQCGRAAGRRPVQLAAARSLRRGLGFQRGEEGLGILQRHVDARHRVEASGDALARRPLAAHGGATGSLYRFFRGFGESGFARRHGRKYG